MAINDLSKVFGIPSPTGTLDLTPRFQTSPATGTLGLEQPSTLQRAGSRISNNLARMGGYDPMQLSNAEQRKQARLAGLQELSYRLSQASAKLSGDPARMQIAQQQEAQRIEAKQDQFKKRQIVEGIDGFKYYVNPDGSFERVFPGLEKASTPSSIERVGVYDLSTGKLEGSLLKSDLQGINAIEQDPTKIIGTLRSPTVTTGKSADIDTWAVTNSEGIRVKDLINPTKEELQEQVKAGNFINKTPVLSTAGKGIEKELGEIRGWNDDGGLLERAMAYKGLVRSGNRIVQNLYDNPESVLAVGDIAQVVDQIGQELTAVGAIVNPEARNTFINKSPQGQDNARIREQFRELAGQTALTESQLLDFAYQIAKVRGQEGKGLSDQDLKNFQKIISAGRTAEQKARALTNFIEGIKSEVQGALEDERGYRNATLVRDPENRQANAVVLGIQDVFSTGFADIQNPFMKQQTPPPTTGGPSDIPRVRIQL